MSTSNISQENSCNNCGKYGHLYSQCKMPITSLGIVAFCKLTNRNIQYLMICRKDTLGFMDFMRGKYSIYNKNYLLNLLNEMTIDEKSNLLSKTFSQLWIQLWGSQVLSNQYKIEEKESSEKFTSLQSGIQIGSNEQYTLESLIEESNQCTQWKEPEWGFPKGRRNLNEVDIDCAKREFSEETGYSKYCLTMVFNMLPFEEIFMGSNYKSYKHKYFLMGFEDNNKYHSMKYDKTEVSKIEWKTFEECISCIRPYNLEKKKMLKDIHSCLLEYKII